MSIPVGFKPMNGEPVPDMTSLVYPVLASPKLDGIRCLIFGGVAYTKRLERIPNRWIQSALQHLPCGFDGELIVGKPTGDDVYNRSQSGVMSEDGRPDFKYHLFDWVPLADPTQPFSVRLMSLNAWNHERQLPYLKVVPHELIRSPAKLAAYEQIIVDLQYEGIMVRAEHGPYKMGRSTVKEGTLLKVKRWYDCEARILSKIEEMENTNTQERNGIGYAKRSSAKAGKVGKGTLGALECALLSPADDPLHPDHHKTRPAITFKLGSGLSDAVAKQLWDDPELVGKTVKFKCQGFTPKAKPRHPVYIGLRDRRDISLP